MNMRFVVVLFPLLMLVSGCGNPTNWANNNEGDLLQHVGRVQSEVDAYLDQNDGRLPIRSGGEQKPLYQKYVINFHELGSKPPSSGYEQGGHYLFVLVDEKDPTVKLFDVRVSQSVASVQMAVNRYLNDKRELPKNEEVSSGFYRVDFSKLNMEPVTVPSSYSGEIQLPLVMDKSGGIFVDYRMDVMQIIQQQKEKIQEGTDARELLLESSIYVPAHSPPTIFRDGDPVFVEKRD
ncbi:hypothetical protein [Mechercharimyces sp. CAU 1602]|uniref:hypothetical protein n=1 Tax=Mechercharimyces sp. CAU 1602 TaxID=2973933 RepID=UPI002163D3DF|nr:hypothetical protein [Mechercharimyces sp. CAU 1602]MCS1350972.1 hypothetical protein [Mechercharimyces sp. CAU 1602]